MIFPNFLSLPVLSDFNFVFLHIFILFFEIFLAYRKISSIGVVEDVLAPGYILDTLVLPEDGTTVVSSRGKECTDGIPSYAIDGLNMIVEFRQFSDLFLFLASKEGFHGLDIR